MKKFIIKVDGKPYEVEVEEVQAVVANNVSKTEQLQSNVNTSTRPSAPSSNSGSGSVLAPMPGNIFKINVKKGDTVAAKQTLLILEAMKMENAITATKAGVVTDIHVAVGDCVPTGGLLITIE